jgi:hypothetical protein
VLRPGFEPCFLSSDDTGGLYLTRYACLLSYAFRRLQPELVIACSASSIIRSTEHSRLPFARQEVGFGLETLSAKRASCRPSR